MRLRKERYGDFGFDAAGRLCELSRADRNRRRRGLEPRTIGARSTGYIKPPDVREWHRAFRDLPADVTLFAFDWEAPYRWTFTIGVGGGEPRAFWPHDGARDGRGLTVLDRRRHPRRAASFLRGALRRLALPYV